MSLTLRVMLSTKLPNASRSISSRSCRTRANIPSVSAESLGSPGIGAPWVRGLASSPAIQARPSAPLHTPY